MVDDIPGQPVREQLIDRGGARPPVVCRRSNGQPDGEARGAAAALRWPGRSPAMALELCDRVLPATACAAGGACEAIEIKAEIAATCAAANRGQRRFINGPALSLLIN